jgi:hypothetical protein
MHKTAVALAFSLTTALFLGCRTGSPDSDRGPNGTVAYFIKVESSVPGARIETNQVFAGRTPLTLKVFGDSPGYFHDFGKPEFVLRALPDSTNEFIQTKIFRTGHGSSPGDLIPGVVFLDLSQPSGVLLIDITPDK